MADKIVLYGTNWCPDCKRSKRFLGEQQIDYEYVDIEEDPAGQRIVEEINQGKRIIPTIIFPDGGVLVEPSNAELAQKLGLTTEPQKEYYQAIIIGGGPAGLTAATYLARETIDTLVLERSAVGGQAAVSEQLDNIPGFPEGTSGVEFGRRLREQAKRFGVEVVQAANVEAIRKHGRYYDVVTNGKEFCADAVLLTTGATYRRLGIPGEEDFIGVNVHFCATCDGAFYRNKKVIVVGGGNSAAEGVSTLLNFTDDVTLLVREAAMESVSHTLRDKIETLQQEGRIQVHYNSEIQEMVGDSWLQKLVVRKRDTGETTTFEPDGVFVFVGLSPVSALVMDLVDTDDSGFVITDKTLQTTLDGLFAAGDVRAGSTKQVASAAGEGATAALMMRDYLRQK